jgi:hypothetical protein
MVTRSILASVFCLLMAVVAMAGGCATGNQVSSGPPMMTTDASGDAPETSSSCSAPKIECSGTCVDPNMDNGNCGGCKKACKSGLVCSDGKCGLTCSPPSVLCSGAPFDAGSPADAGSESGPVEASTEAGGGDAGEPDATPDASAHDSGPVDAGMPEAGTTAPYCATLNNDPKNCGACGKACNPSEVCNDGTCIPHCKSGQTLCPDNTGCKGPGECCSTSDCSILGETCPFPGGTCTCPPDQIVCASGGDCISMTSCCPGVACPVKGETCAFAGDTCVCPTGQTPCTANNTCIPEGSCCTNADCTVTGETCTTPGSSCACPTGDTVCTASNSCISSADCCTAAECPDTANVMTTNCTGGACGIMTCNAGWVNVDGTYADGCECQDDAFAKACGANTNVGTVDVGQSFNEVGVLPVAGEVNWFEATFPENTLTTYHPKITLSVNPGSQFLFNVYDATCAATAMSCGTEGGSSTARTTWEVSETDTLVPISIFPTVGTGGVVYIEVYRASGAPTCSSYTLTISD